MFLTACLIWSRKKKKNPINDYVHYEFNMDQSVNILLHKTLEIIKNGHIYFPKVNVKYFISLERFRKTEM